MPAAPARPETKPACRATLLEIAREADKRTHDRHGMTALQVELAKLSTDSLGREERAAVGLQVALMTSYLQGPMRKPKVLPPVGTLESIYACVAAEATETFLFGCMTGASVLSECRDEQRCVVNLGADACLVGLDGGVGMHTKLPPTRFVNAVRTSASRKLVTIQAQGPKTPGQVSDLITAAERHAAQGHCKRVIFVNASIDKVPGFGHAVESRDRRSNLQLAYKELPWIDGEVPETAAGRATITDFVHALSRDILSAGQKTLVVFNCHIGLDRSGITNALTQLMIDGSAHDDPLEAAESVLKKIKRARPHGVSTVFRFRLIYQCWKDLRNKRFQDPLSATSLLTA